MAAKRREKFSKLGHDHQAQTTKLFRVEVSLQFMRKKSVFTFLCLNRVLIQDEKESKGTYFLNRGVSEWPWVDVEIFIVLSCSYCSERSVQG